MIDTIYGPVRPWGKTPDGDLVVVWIRPKDVEKAPPRWKGGKCCNFILSEKELAPQSPIARD